MSKSWWLKNADLQSPDNRGLTEVMFSQMLTWKNSSQSSCLYARVPFA